MDNNIKPASPDDIFVWADGTRCYRSEYDLGHYAQMSDDFRVIPVSSPEWHAIEAQGATSLEPGGDDH